MRAVLIVNPRATTTTISTRDILIGTLRSTFDLQIEITTQRGHAQVLARRAAEAGLDYVLTFGGDGTVNEAVNGLMSANLAPAALPILGPLPGGSANVFTRALGFSNNPVQAVGELIMGINDNDLKMINLGLASGFETPRYFTFSLGVGLDAEVIETMESLRRKGKRASPARYLGVALGRYARSNRHEPKLTVTTADGQSLYGVFTLIVQNATAWTYFGPIALSTSNGSNFNSGLDLLAIKRMDVLSTLNLATRLARRGADKKGADGVDAQMAADFVHFQDQSSFELHASEPMPLQIDGEFHSRINSLYVESVPQALAVIHKLDG